MSTTLAERPAGQMTIRDRLKSQAVLDEIAKAMPSHCKPERMARVALTCLNRTPALAKCTEASFFECLLSLSQWGLEPDGRRAHLIPYGNKCTLIIDYKGYVELAYRSGTAKNIHSSVVYRGDLFDYDRGKVRQHKPWEVRDDKDRPEDKGEVFAAYCIVEMAGGVEHHEVMWHSEVEAIRKRSKAGGAGPWVTDWNEMAKKTVFRRASKWIPLSAEIRDAFDRDDDRLDSIPQQTGGLQRAAPVNLELAAGEITGEQADEMDSTDKWLADARAAFEAADTPMQVQSLKETWGGQAATNELAGDIDTLAAEALSRIKGKK